MSSAGPSDFAARFRAVVRERGSHPISALAERVPEPDTDGRAQRYRLRESDGRRWIECVEAPGVRVRLERGLEISEAELRKMGPRVLLLDGAGQFGPTLDNERQLYNLDHHSGCVRAFTLATCEQALVMVAKGLDLQSADWVVVANEPDLDTLLALWVLLNHRRIPDLSPSERDVLLPMIRLEGAIDANGPEVAQFCGLTQAALRRARATLDDLFERERQARSSEPPLFDPVEYTRSALAEVDALVFGASGAVAVDDVQQVYGHVEVGDGRVAVVCRDPSGIYEVESRLKKIWTDRLGLIALENGPGRYTLRRVSSLTRISLERAYAWLNALDPVVDGRPSEKRWGGSDDIGGSPRREGSRLTPEELIDVLELAYDPPGWGRALLRGAAASLLGVGMVGAALLGSWLALPKLLAWLPPAWATFPQHLLRLAGFGGLLFVASGLLSWIATRRRTGDGWQLPARGAAALALTPLIVAIGCLGGLWAPRTESADLPELALAGAAVLALAAGSEALFRGLIHGRLIRVGRIQGLDAGWFVSRATWISALAYALVTWWLASAWIATTPLLLPPPLSATWLTPLAALAAGLLLGLLRERALSLWPGMAAHAAGGAALLALKIAETWAG